LKGTRSAKHPTPTAKASIKNNRASFCPSFKHTHLLKCNYIRNSKIF
jgi:hypothetical protein